MALYFAYPDVLFSNSPVNLSGAKRRVVSGPRQLVYEAETSDSSFSVFSNTAIAPDMCILTDAHTLTYRDASPILSITGASDSAFAVSAQNFTSSILLAGLKNGGRDHLFEFTPSSAKQYWRARIITSAVIDQVIGKLYLCRKLSLGREPTDRSIISYQASDAVGSRPIRSIRLVFEGISAARYETFKNRILRYKSTNPVFLVASANQAIFNGSTLIHAVIESVAVRSRSVESVSFDLNLREIL